MKQETKTEKTTSRNGIHWNAMGAGLIAASLIYPEQQTALLSMGGSSFIMGLLNKKEKSHQTTETEVNSH